MAKRSKGERQRLDQRVAIIEEVADNIYSVKFILQSLGYGVLSVSSGSGFAQRIAQFEPQLVIVDMMIPEKGGYSAIRDVRRNVSKQLPILAITAAAMQGDEKAVIRAGSTDTLSKPYSVVELQVKIKGLMGDGLNPLTVDG